MSHYTAESAAARLLACLLMLGSASVPATTPGLQGAEFLVSTDSLFFKQRTALAAQPGGYVAAWSSFGQDGDRLGIYAQRFDAEGQALGGEFQVNATWALHQSHPAIAASTSGSFVIAWTSEQLVAGQTRRLIRGQRYGNDGLPLGGEFQASMGSSVHHGWPSVAMAPDGRFVMAWEASASGGGFGSFVRSFTAEGAPLGDELQFRSGGQINGAPALAMLPDGGFLTAWAFSASGQSTVAAQRFSPTGSPEGELITISAASAEPKSLPVLSMNRQGSGVVVWSERPIGSTIAGLVAQRIEANGQPVGERFPVNQFQSQKQGPVPGLDAAGNLLVVWASALQDGTPWSIYLRHFPADGGPGSAELRVNTTTAGSQFWPWLAVQPDGRAMVIWDNGEDPLRNHIYGQRLGSADLVFADGFEPLP